jgi:hypothetical protein
MRGEIPGADSRVGAPTAGSIRDFAEPDIQRRIDAAAIAAAYLRGIGYDEPEFRAYLYDLVLDGLNAMTEQLRSPAQCKKDVVPS